MKKLFILFILSMLITASAEASDVTVLLNGKTLQSPIPAQLVNDRTMLPMRSVFEALGAKVTWFGEDRMIFATRGNSLITMKIGVPKMSVQKTDSNKNVSVSLDTAPYIDRDYTLVPVRAVSEALDAEVIWDAEKRTVHINSK